MPISSAGKINNGRRGITLVEMVVVLCIVGLIAAISFPALAAGLESVRMVSATDSVATFLNSAANRAERKQQAGEIIIQPKERMLEMYSAEPGFHKELRLPQGVAIEAPEEEQRILFLPGSTIPAIGIQLVNGHNAHRLVHLDPMTGFPRVESVEPNK